jgi:hypothetical protein
MTRHFELILTSKWTNTTNARCCISVERVRGEPRSMGLAILVKRFFSLHGKIFKHFSYVYKTCRQFKQQICSETQPKTYDGNSKTDLDVWNDADYLTNRHLCDPIYDIHGSRCRATIGSSRALQIFLQAFYRTQQSKDALRAARRHAPKRLSGHNLLVRIRKRLVYIVHRL